MTQESAINGVVFKENTAVIDSLVITAKDLTNNFVRTLYDLKQSVTYQLPNRDGFSIRLSEGNYFMIGKIKHIRVCGLEYTTVEDSPNDESDGWHVIGLSYYHPESIDGAITEFVRRIKGITPWALFDNATLDLINIMQNGILKAVNHYDYLNETLISFWKEVFNTTPDEMWCGGIVSAHGDKCYQYRDEWEEKGIPFNRGAMLYLLTYTSEFNNQEKSKSREWVIENYQKYLPMLEKAEQSTVEKFRVPERDVV